MHDKIIGGNSQQGRTHVANTNEGGLFLHTTNEELIRHLEDDAVVTIRGATSKQAKNLSFNRSTEMMTERKPSAILIDLGSIEGTTFQKMHIIGLVCYCTKHQIPVIVVCSSLEHSKVLEWVTRAKEGSGVSHKNPHFMTPDQAVQHSTSEIIFQARAHLEEE